MIVGKFHQGSGLGNQLHRYVMTRVLAADKEYDWSMWYIPDDPHKEPGFKGKFFLEQPRLLNPDLADQASFPNPSVTFWQEKKLMENGVDVRGYDPDINFVEDNTVIDGEFQDPRYFAHRMRDISKWLAVEPYPVSDSRCMVGFRGGEYAVYPDLFLPQKYWTGAFEAMAKHNPAFTYQIHTDDPQLASQVFQGNEFIHDMSVNWRAMRYAKYAIIANSSFYILPRLLKHYEDPTAVTIAPRYWARHNTRVWALPQNYYPQFTYM